MADAFPELPGGVMGMPGITAGAVGSTACQIARIKGASVVASAA